MRYLLILLIIAALVCFPAKAYDKYWGLRAVGLKGTEKSSASVVVAVIDSGVDGLVSKNSRSFVPDVGGTSHGTHVAGIIRQVAPNTTIMSVRYYSDANNGATNLKNTVNSFRYAVEQGVSLINYSGGGPQFSEDEYLALKAAEDKGILVVVAAGNDHKDLDRVENRYYPCSYGLSNILCVAAIDVNSNLMISSSWGVQSVNVAAPGENILSTTSGLPGFGYMSGTSMATAFVTGVASLLLSRDSSLTSTQLKKAIITSCDRLPQLYGKVSSGKVNAGQALSTLHK